MGEEIEKREKRRERDIKERLWEGERESENEIGRRTD